MEFTAAEAAQKSLDTVSRSMPEFTAAKAAQKMRDWNVMRSAGFTAAEAAQKGWHHHHQCPGRFTAAQAARPAQRAFFLPSRCPWQARPATRGPARPACPAAS